MDPKIIVVFALLAVALAEIPFIGFRMDQASPQVIGGESAPKGAYPFIVSLQLESAFMPRHFCAGSILNSNWIITAAHCVQAIPQLSKLLIRAGKQYINTVEESEQVARAEKAIIHENYLGGVGPFDIAVIKLRTPLKFTKEIQPVALATPGSEPSGDAIIAGWGSISRRGQVMPIDLQHATLEYLTYNQCADAIRAISGGTSYPLHKTNVCTGPLSGARSACSGDSGGPLLSYHQRKAVLTGIVSWGYVPCGSNGAPSVYTKVSDYNAWIDQQIATY